MRCAGPQYNALKPVKEDASFRVLSHVGDAQPTKASKSQHVAAGPRWRSAYKTREEAGIHSTHIYRGIRVCT